MSDLAKRATACKGFRWMPGMRRLTFDGGHLYPARVADDGTYPGGLFPVPDLTDPATLGCLLALVREALGCDCAIRRWSHGWALVDAGALSYYSYVFDTEAEALVSALEAAEGREVSDEVS